jgi:protein-S-isoprenylcysteine O-methyltransferase Ste14
VVEVPEEPAAVLGVTFSDIYYYINIAYWSCLLVSVLTGSDFFSQLAHFELYTAVMCGTSLLFTLYHTVKFAGDLRRHLQSEARADWRALLRYAWNALFWAGFVCWYAAPPVTSIVDYTGGPGAVMCLFGAALAVAAALQAGMFSFMGSPSVPRRLQTGGVYALLRHPQALGNMMFLIGFSIAGGALWASLVFCLAFAFYIATIVPAEERMLKEAFGDQYTHYAERVPRFAWALVLLLLLEGVMLWRYQPWAVPIEVAPPPPGRLA